MEGVALICQKWKILYISNLFFTSVLLKFSFINSLPVILFGIASNGSFTFGCKITHPSLVFQIL